MAKKTSPKQAESSTPDAEEQIVSLPEVDLDSYSETLSDAVKSQLFDAPKAKNKPDISRLPDGIVDGRPIFTTGDKIVIERYASILEGCPYLDTRSYKVQSVDMVTGKIWLWDETFQQCAMDNWKAGLKIGQVYKLANGVTTTVGKKKRGRPRKNPVEVAKPVELGPDGKPIKKKRGRPAGSKNRPKEEIKAEKAEKKALRAAKKKLTPKKRTKKGA